MPKLPEIRYCRRLATVLLAASLVAGCTMPTPYAPAVDGKGYSEQQLESDRYRVSFAGNSATPRETVENYLLYRAAEVTLQTGHDRFRIVRQEIEKETRYRATLSGFSRFGFRRFTYYQPFFGDFATSTARPITTYQAFANIIVVSGEENERDDQTYDAREILENLGPVIVRSQADGG